MHCRIYCSKCRSRGVVTIYAVQFNEKEINIRTPKSRSGIYSPRTEKYTAIPTLCAYIFLIWQRSSQSDNDYPHKDNEIPTSPTITPTKITITHKSNEILLATKKSHRGKLSAMAFFSCPAGLFFRNAPKKDQIKPKKQKIRTTILSK